MVIHEGGWKLALVDKEEYKRFKIKILSSKVKGYADQIAKDMGDKFALVAICHEVIAYAGGPTALKLTEKERIVATGKSYLEPIASAQHPEQEAGTALQEPAEPTHGLRFFWDRPSR